MEAKYMTLPQDIGEITEHDPSSYGQTVWRDISHK